MSSKGIIIDVGFTSDIKDFINEIEGQFKKVDFDSMLGLSDAFDKQIKNVRSQLVKLQDEIDGVINGTSKGDATKQMQALNKAVDVLTSSFKEMLKVMPGSQASKLTAGLDSIISDMKEMSDVCDNTTDAVKNLSNISNGNIKFVDKSQVKELEEVLKILEKSETFESSKKSYTEKGALSEIINLYNKYLNILDEVADNENNTSLSKDKKVIELDKLKAACLETCAALEELIAKYKEDLGGKGSQKVKIFDGFNVSIDSIRQEIESASDELLNYVLKRQTEIREEINKLSGNKNLEVTGSVVKEVSNQTNKNKITVPMDISTKASTLTARALTIIKEVQSKVGSNPLEVEVAFVSQYGTKRNQEILNQINGSLNNISDDKIREKLSKLVDDFKVGNKLHLAVEVEGSKQATNAVRNLIKDFQEQINSADLVLRPEIELTGEVKSKLQSQLDDLSRVVNINLGAKDEKGQNVETKSIQRASNTVLALQKNLERVVKAVEDQTVAFQVSEQTLTGTVSREISSLQELIGWLSTVESSIKDISKAIVVLPDMKFEFDQTSIEKLESLKNAGTFSSLFNFEGKSESIANELKELKKNADVELKLDSSKFSEGIKEAQQQVQNSVKQEISSLGSLQNKLDEVTGAVNNKTEAFKKEQQVVQSAAKSEINALNPLQNLESSYNNFKKFYDNNDLESEAGAQAALSYYTAYKEALVSKLNKKDLQNYTIGKTSNLFTGNYSNYKKGLGGLDLSGLNSQITKYQEIIDKFNQPEVISVINALSQAIKQLLDAGSTSAEATKLLENLNKVINNLGGKNSAEKISRITKNLESFQKSVQTLDISDSGFINSINAILEKGEQLKVLAEVLKSSKKQMDAASKAATQADNLKQAQQNLEKYENAIYEAVNQKSIGKNETVIYQQMQATKEGLIQVIALVKEASSEYKKYIYTTTNGTDLLQKGFTKDQAALAKEAKQYEAYMKLKQLTIPGATNLGTEGVSFTPESKNWDKLIEKAQEFGIEVKNITKIMRTVDEVGQESFQIFTNLSRITVGMNSSGVLFQKDEVLDATHVIKEFENNVDNLKKSLKNSFSDDMGTDKFINTLEKISQTWKELTLLNDKGLISNEEIGRLSGYFNTFKTSISSFSLDKISSDNKTPEFVNQLRQAENQLDLVKIALDKVSSGEAFTEEDFANIKTFISQMRELNNTVGDKGNNLGNIGAKENLLGKIAETLSKNTAMSKELRQEFKLLQMQINSFGDNIPADKLTEFGYQFEKLKTKMKATGQTGLSFFDGIAKRAKSMSQSLIAMYLSLWDIIRYVRYGLRNIKELDTAFTEMRKVSDESVQSLKNFQKTSFDIAASVGTTSKQIQNSTADWMRLGESLTEASKSAEASNILLNVSEFESIDEATESLVAMSAAYDELDKMDIVDKLNNIGNNFSISTDGLATALQKSASALTTAGNDMDEALALVTAGNAVVQDPDSVGAGMRTIALRITGTEAAKEELEELGEDTSDFVVQTIAKSQEKIKSFTKVASNNFEGFDILDDNGNFKSTYEILLGISEIYEEIVATDKEYGSNMANGLLEALAGKNRSNIAASILQNPDLLKEVYEYSQDSEGSALKENERYLDSIEGRIQLFTNEVQEFWYNLISSDTVKAIVSAGTKIVDVIGDIVGALGEVGTVMASIGIAYGIHSLKNSGGRVKMFALITKYATESFSREVCEFWCTSEW